MVKNALKPHFGAKFLHKGNVPILGRAAVPLKPQTQTPSSQTVALSLFVFNNTLDVTIAIKHAIILYTSIDQQLICLTSHSTQTDYNAVPIK